MGSWKIMLISLPRMSRLASEGLQEIAAQRIAPAILPGGSGMRRRIEFAVTDLPQPDSPTMASVSPSFTSKDTPSTARAVGRPEMGLEVLDLEQRHALDLLRHARIEGVLRPSPRRFTARTVTERKIAGMKTM